MRRIEPSAPGVVEDATIGNIGFTDAGEGVAALGESMPTHRLVSSSRI